MKIVLAEMPFTKDRDISVEKSYCTDQDELVVAVYDIHSADNSAFFKEVEDADVIVDAYVYFGREELDRLKKCSLISFQATGYNEVDLAYAEEKGIAVTSLCDYCTQETAENAMMLMLALQRGLRRYDRVVQQEKSWDYLAGKDLGLTRVAGQTMGIAGLGKIGKSVAKKAGGFDMELIAYDPYVPKEAAEALGVELVGFEELLERSDVISIHMNLTDENYHIFNDAAFEKMKKRPIIINEGRGALIDEGALVRALDSGRVRGAGLDMLELENPDLNSCPLLGRENVILTPHSGFYSQTSEYLLSKLSMDNVKYYMAGEYDKVKVLRNNVRRRRDEL